MYIQIIHPEYPYSTVKHTTIIIDDDVTAMPVQIDNRWVEIFHIPDCFSLKDVFFPVTHGHGDGKKEFISIKGNRVNLVHFRGGMIFSEDEDVTLDNFNTLLPLDKVDLTGNHYTITAIPTILNYIPFIKKSYYYRIIFMNDSNGGYLFSRPLLKAETYHLPFYNNIHIINKTDQKTFLDSR